MLNAYWCHNTFKKDGKADCNCLPSCTSINYMDNVEVTRSDLAYEKYLKAIGSKLGATDGSDYTLLRI